MYSCSKFRVFINYASRPLSRSFSYSSSVCPDPPKNIVTIVDATSYVGEILSLLLKQDPNIKELRLYSKNDKACGVAMDLSSIDTSTRVLAYIGPKMLKEAIEDANIVVITGGLQTKFCESQARLFYNNLDDVRTLAMYMSEFNPQGIFCIARPPVNALVPMVCEEYKKAEVLDPRKIIGITNIGMMRANTILAKYGTKNSSGMVCPVIGGLCPKTTTAVFSQSKPSVAIPPEKHEEFQAKIGHAENHLLKIKEKDKSGPLSLSHALATSRFINSLTKAVVGDEECVECAFVKQTGHICKFLPYMSSIVTLGPEGVESCHMPKLDEKESERLKCAHIYLLQLIALGESVASGGLSLQKQKKCLERKIKCELVQRQKEEKEKEETEKESKTDKKKAKDKKTKGETVKSEKSKEKSGKTSGEKDKESKDKEESEELREENECCDEDGKKIKKKSSASQ